MRTRLSEITNGVLDVAQHQELIRQLRSDYPHSIDVIPSFLDEPLEDYNCVMYALDLVARLDMPCRPFGQFYADTKFLTALISVCLTPAVEAVGNIVVWSESGVVKHTGLVVAENRATSKWGCGNLYEHGLLEVPHSYGAELTYFEPIAGETSVDLLRRYQQRKL
jgi:hypothetical protein